MQALVLFYKQNICMQLYTDCLCLHNCIKCIIWRRLFQNMKHFIVQFDLNLADRNRIFSRNDCICIIITWSFINIKMVVDYIFQNFWKIICICNRICSKLTLNNRKEFFNVLSSFTVIVVRIHQYGNVFIRCRTKAISQSFSSWFVCLANLMDKYYHNVRLKRINISLQRACNITINIHTHFRL